MDRVCAYLYLPPVCLSAPLVVSRVQLLMSPGLMSPGLLHHRPSYPRACSLTLLPATSLYFLTVTTVTVSAISLPSTLKFRQKRWARSRFTPSWALWKGSQTKEVINIEMSGRLLPLFLWLKARFNVSIKSLQSCPTLCNTMDYSPPGSSVHGILWVRILEWVAISSSRGSSPPGINFTG